MPIRPEPRTYRCPKCSWTKTVAPLSDALLEGKDVFRKCPKCGQAPLEVSTSRNATSWLKRTILGIK